MSTATLTADQRDQLAQETAEYIAAMPNPQEGEGFIVVGQDDRPRTISDIKAVLLAGHVWISWMDDKVIATMRALHGEPTGYTEAFNA